MRQLLALERRLQDIEIAMRNHGRTGKIKKDGVKFDEQRKNWMVKFEQGDGDQIFESDWLPWGSMANGAIKISIPPRDGQLVRMSGPAGSPEQGWIEPHHGDPKDNSPHDKKDEILIRVEKPKDQSSDTKHWEDGEKAGEGKEKVDLHITSKNFNVTSDKTTHSITNKSVDLKTETRTAKAKSSSEETDDHTLKSKNRTVNAQTTKISSSVYQLGGKVLINC